MFARNNRHPCNLAKDQRHSHANGEGEESSQPALAFILLIVAIPEQAGVVSITYLRTIHVPICIPSLRPGVCKVDNENQLDEDEEETPDHAEVHPHLDNN